MTKLTTLMTIHKLEERYPFNEEELEILVRCHDNIGESNKKCIERDEDNPSFLVKLALASPYSYFFLPGDSPMRSRVNWIEEHVLPPGFSNELRAAMACVPFVEYANQGINDKPLERFVEGVACTGRPGKHAECRLVFLSGAKRTAALCPGQNSDLEKVTSVISSPFQSLVEWIGNEEVTHRRRGPAP